LLMNQRIRYSPHTFLGAKFDDLFAGKLNGINSDGVYDHWNQNLKRFGGVLNCDTLRRMDFVTKLTDNHLFKCDRASMMESLEVRVPFLDEFLLDNLLPIDASELVKEGDLKSVLKDLASKYLPLEVWNRPKHGFNVPLSEYMANQWEDTVENLLDWGEGNLDIFDFGYLRNLQMKNKNGKHISRALWSPVCFIAWVKAHPIRI